MDLRSTFVGFAMSVLGMNLYPWQQDALWALEGDGSERTQVALVTCNESGKTSHVAAAAILANAALHPGSVTVDTAGVFRQVKFQLWPTIKQYGAGFADWQINDTDLRTPTGSMAVGFSTDDADSFEGWHHPELLIVVDEAKSVPASIYGAIRRCKPKRLLIMSSPGGPKGEFYEAFGRKRDLYEVIRADVFDCPHWKQADIVSEIMNACPELDRAQVQVMVEQQDRAGLLEVAKHPLIHSMLFARFMMEGEDEAYPWTQTIIDSCRQSPPQHLDAEPVAFLDFAAGGDENVIAVRRGNKVLPLIAWREKDTMKACGEFIIHLRKQGLRPENVFADGDGLGIPILDRMAELGWRVNRCHNNSAARQPDRYKNCIAEMYWEAAKQARNRSIILPDDDKLDSQLITRQSFPASDGKLQLESKKDMKKNGLTSPDRADAVVGVMTSSNPLQVTKYTPEVTTGAEENHDMPEGCYTG